MGSCCCACCGPTPLLLPQQDHDEDGVRAKQLRASKTLYALPLATTESVTEHDKKCETKLKNALKKVNAMRASVPSSHQHQHQQQREPIDVETFFGTFVASRFAIETVWIAAVRHLAPNHPLRALLAPHLGPYLIAENVQLRERHAEQLASEATRNLVDDRRQMLYASSSPPPSIPKELRLLFPHFQTYVRDVVCGLIYAVRNDLSADRELQHFLTALDQNDATTKLRDDPNALSQFVTNVIFFAVVESTYRANTLARQQDPPLTARYSDCDDDEEILSAMPADCFLIRAFERNPLEGLEGSEEVVSAFVKRLQTAQKDSTLHLRTSCWM